MVEYGIRTVVVIVDVAAYLLVEANPTTGYVVTRAKSIPEVVYDLSPSTSLNN